MNLLNLLSMKQLASALSNEFRAYRVDSSKV